MDTRSRIRLIRTLIFLTPILNLSPAASVAATLPILAPVATLPTPPDLAPAPVFGTGPKAYFGRVLGVDRHTMIAGVASGHAAYAYKKTSSGAWAYDGILLGPEGSVVFYSAGVSDNVALLGGSTVDGVGFVYVFRRTHDEWQFAQKLIEPQPEADTLAQYFGFQLSVSGDVAVVSNFTDGSSQGAAYVFRKTQDGRFIYQVKLSADDGSDGGTFGWAVATDGEQILVSSLGNGGTAYIFQRVRGVWTKEQKLKSPPVTGPAGVQQYFGNAVAISGHTAVIASPNADYLELHPGSKSGATFVFVRRRHVWHFEQKLVDPHAYQGVFGQAVAVQGGQILVSAWGFTDPSAAPSERIYLFDHSGRSEWTPIAVMSEGNGSYSFGYEIAWSGRWMITSEIAKPLANTVFDGQVDVYELPRSPER